MESKFISIIRKHEDEDFEQINCEKKFFETMLTEYSNCAEIIELAEKKKGSLQDFLTGNVVDFPIVPIRQSEKFYIKKHTLSQIPYYHNHNFYEMVYVHKGSCRQIIKKYGDIILTEKQCMILSPGTIHMICKSNHDDVIFKIIIPIDMFEKTGKLIFNDLNKGEIKIFEKVNESAEIAILKLLKELQKSNQFEKLIVQSYLTLIFVELKSNAKSNSFIENILNDYFKNNLSTATLSEFANLQNYNTNYLSRLIKKQLGKSFSELLCDYRMNCAKSMLTNTQKSIGEISFMVGYSTLSGFYKQWCNCFGMSPIEYREQSK